MKWGKIQSTADSVLGKSIESIGRTPWYLALSVRQGESSQISYPRVKEPVP
jgi:hypothetical protein